MQAITEPPLGLSSPPPPVPSAGSPGWWAWARPRLLLLAAVALVWGHTVGFDFVWDDTFFIRELTSIRSLRNIPEMFTSLSAQSSYPEGFVLFRPLRTVHYALLYQLGGGQTPQPWLFHLANVVWHGVVVLLLFSVARRLLQRFTPASPRLIEPLAVVAALGFGLHPVVSEVVCWAKSLDDLMAGAFTLCALRTLLDWTSPRRALGWALVWFALAVYAKESALPMAAFAFLVFRVVHRFPWVRSARLTAGFVAIAIIFLVHQRLVVGRTSQTAPISGTYAQTLLDMLPVAPAYLRLLFGLPPFRIDYSFMAGGHAFLSGPVLLGGVLLSGAVVGVAWAWRRRELGLASLGWTWAGLFLLPVSNLVPMMQYMAERFLYLPLVGCTLAGAALLGLIGQRRVVVALGAGVAVLWAVVSWDRSWIWRDEITLFVESSRQSPRTPRVEENAAAAFFKLPAIEQAFGLVPGTRKLYAPRAGTVDWAAAIMALQRACTLFPKEENLANALATAHAQAGHNREAVQGFATLAREHPTRALYWANLGRAQLEGKNLTDAEVALRRALALAREDPLAWRTLAAVHWQKEDFEAARQCFERLQSLEPGNVEDRHWLQQATLRTKGQMRSSPSVTPQ